MNLSKGFTLIEILVVIAIVSGVAVLIGLFTLDISNFGIFLGDTIGAQQELQQTMNLMLIEIRSIGPSDSGSYPIAAVASNSFTFFSNIDSDNSFERVRYFLDGTTFKKGVVKASGAPPIYNLATEKISILVNNVLVQPGTNIFSYYNAKYMGSGSALPFPFPIASVRMVRVDLTSDRTPQDIQSRVTYSISAKLRNINE
jgi:prepilin-type N-terminal cleavage/methylation domain-containing protein